MEVEETKNSTAEQVIISLKRLGKPSSVYHTEEAPSIYGGFITVNAGVTMQNINDAIQSVPSAISSDCREVTGNYYQYTYREQKRN